MISPKESLRVSTGYGEVNLSVLTKSLTDLHKQLKQSHITRRR